MFAIPLDAARPTSSSDGDALVRRGGCLDLRMRRARRTDLPVIWGATLQTVWDDLPGDERARLDRATWEAHFRRKVEAFVEGNRTERWVGEGPGGEILGYVIVGESGFLTPEAHAFLYDIWVAPEVRGQSIGRALVGFVEEWARKRGLRKVKLEVAESNARARHLYESLGFRAERHYLGKALE